MMSAAASADAYMSNSRRERPVLIVCHGPDRGRVSTFLPLLLRSIRRGQPRLRRLLLLHATGMPPPSLAGIGAVLFMLGDPLDCYPQCAAEARAIAADARARGITVLNSPEGLENTSKARQSSIWRRAGLPCAGATPAENEDMLRSLLPQLSFPAILRFDKGHTQVGMFFCATIEEAEKCLPKLRYPAVALDYIDTRSSWKEAEPDSIFASYFHKKRSMVFPGAVFNNHIFFSSDPIVGSHSSTFAAAESGAAPPRIDEMIRADIDYSLSPPEQPDLMRAAVRALGLDLAAIDYSSLPDGRIVLWEANPYFDLPHRSKALLAASRQLELRNPRYIHALARDLGRLAGFHV